MRLIVITTGILALQSCPVAADEPPAVSNNPFARPSSEVTRATAGTLVLTGSGEVSIQLNATMVGETGGLANVAGRIIRPGDEVDGFVLLAVYEDRAEFEKGGSKTTVYVKPELEEDDEQ